MSLPNEYQGSPAFQFIQSRGWNWQASTAPNIELEVCPYCKKSEYGHCYVEIHGPGDEQKNRDGLHLCHRCGKGGSLYSLKEHLGVVIPGVQSRKDWAGHEREIESLPDVDAAHQALLEDEAAMDYLINGRRFSREIIEQQKLGFVPKRYFRECGEVRAILYPYLVNGNCVYVHYRTLPTMPMSENKVPKAFNSPTGWDAPLYNGGILLPGLTDILMVEGEANCIAAMDHGVANVTGVPGANFKKAEWIDVLDKLDLDKIYICYDKDKVGQKAAQTLASRIGVEKCWKITLPEFVVTTDEGVTRSGKDINEWFATGGGTAEELERLKQEAVLFDVDGVTSTGDAIDEFHDEILGRGGVEPKYKTPWPSLNKLIGFDTGDVIDVVAEEKVGKTTFGMNLMEHMADAYGEDGIIICLEMTRAKLARKWICHKQGIADNIPKNAEEAEALKQEFLKAIPILKGYAGNREGNLYLCYPKYKTRDDIYKLIIDCIRRYGVTWIMLDNLQRLADTTSGGENRTHGLSQISKVTSQICKDYGVQMIRIIQPHNIQKGQICTSRDADGASQIRKDCDCSMSLHRNLAQGVRTVNEWETMPYIEQETAMGDKMLLNNDLCRYAGGGQCTLHYDGARSTISEYTVGQIAKIKAEASKDVGYAAQIASLLPASQSPAQEISL